MKDTEQNMYVYWRRKIHIQSIYTGYVSHKKRNGGFSVACDRKVPYLFTSSNQATPAEENDTNIIKFDRVILILWPFVKTQSFSNFAWFLRPMSEGLCWEWPFIVVFWGSPLIRVNKRNTVQRDSPKHYWKAIPDIILRSSVAKIQLNLKMTVFQEMGKESKLPNQI